MWYVSRTVIISLLSPFILASQHVRVKAMVVEVETGAEQMTNDFRFTWCREEGEPLKRMVVPMTYQGTLCFFSLVSPK